MILPQGLTAFDERIVSDSKIQLYYNANEHASGPYDRPISDDGSRSYVVTFNTKDAQVAQYAAKHLVKYIKDSLQSGRELSLGSLALTLPQLNPHLEYVIALKARSLSALANQLDSESLKVSRVKDTKARLGWVFNGQGGQWHAMGRELLAAYPIFASSIAEADSILVEYGADWSLLDEMTKPAESSRVSEVGLAQTTTVALQLGLVRLLQSWEIYPSAVVSHSSGEIAAGFAVGALSFREALAVVYHRDRLLRKQHAMSESKGAMMAVGIKSNEIEEFTADLQSGGRVVVACVNSSESLTLAGDVCAIDEVLMRLQHGNKFARKLKVDMAYHSHHMEPVALEYSKTLSQILPSHNPWAGSTVFASPVTGEVIDPLRGFDPEHWVRNLTDTVLFSDAFEAIIDKVDAIVEIGPHNTLAGPIRQVLQEREVAYSSCLQRNIDAVDTMQDLVRHLLVLGYPVSLNCVNLIAYEQRSEVIADLRSSFDLERIFESSFNHAQNKCYWVPDVSHDIPTSIKNTMRRNLEELDDIYERKMVRAAYYFIDNAIKNTLDDDQDVWPEHSKLMYDWMNAVLTRGKACQYDSSSNLWSQATRGIKQSLFDELSHANAAGRLLIRTGENLPDILRGRVTASELMAEDNLLVKYYTEAPQLRHRVYRQLAELAKSVAVNRPGLKVLQIGSSFGDVARAVLDACSYKEDYTGSLLGSYTITDASAISLKGAQTEFVHSSNLVDLQKWDPKAMTVMQSGCTIEEGFDLVVAPMTIQTSSNRANALRNLRRLIVPGGRLILMEVMHDKLDAQLVFGSLPQWWSREDLAGTTSSPLSMQDWNHLLHETGFTGAEFHIEDCEQRQLSSVGLILSSIPAVPSLPSSVSIVHTSSVPEYWDTRMVDALQQNLGVSVAIETWESVQLEDKLYIFTGAMSTPSFAETDEALLRKLERIITHSRGILWLSCNEHTDTRQQEHTRFRALLRKIRKSPAGCCKRCVELDLEQSDGESWTPNNINHIINVLKSSFDEDAASTSSDWEYAVKNDILYVPRVFPLSDTPIDGALFYENVQEDLYSPTQPPSSDLENASNHRDQVLSISKYQDRRFDTLRLGQQRVHDNSAVDTRLSYQSPSQKLVQALKLTEGGVKAPSLYKIGYIVQALQSQLAMLLRIDESEILPDRPPSRQGVDSIAAVDLRNWLMAAGNVKVPLSEIAEANSLNDLASCILSVGQVGKDHGLETSG